MVNPTILLLIPLLPALGALINGVRAAANPHTHKNRTITNAIALGSTGLSALLAAWTVITYVGGGMSSAFQHAWYTWIPAGLGHAGANGIANFGVDFAFRIDTLSCTMLLIVTWIGFLIHVYATGYMAHEEGYTRFFAYLNLFMFMMLLLVLGANYLVMFVGWEGVGLCSYLLIGFYYDKNFAADAGKKAFVANRIGDFGFILGIFLIFNTFGTADYGKVFALASANPAAYAGIATTICLLLFVGACGKSAQIPLYVWLPDAMAGPTPVSALIHAATMVTAGVYMIVRSNVLFRLSPDAMLVVAIVGAVTAIFAATIGIAQNDIKKVLAYSTVSQLGFMFLAAGVGALSWAPNGRAVPPSGFARSANQPAKLQHPKMTMTRARAALSGCIAITMLAATHGVDAQADTMLTYGTGDDTHQRGTLLAKRRSHALPARTACGRRAARAARLEIDLGRRIRCGEPAGRRLRRVRRADRPPRLCAGGVSASEPSPAPCAGLIRSA